MKKIFFPTTLSPLEFRIFFNYIKLLIGNRFVSAASSGSIRLFGKTFSYGNRGSLYGMFKEIFLEKIYFIETTNEPLKILDCGSNMGMSLLYFRLLAPNAVIEAFEPNPHTFKILSKNVFDNKLNITLHQVGLSLENNTASLYTDTADLSSQSASLTKHLQTKKKEVQAVDVKLVRLSDFVTDEIDILKLDIEGAEGEVLEELERENKLIKIKKIFIEYHFDGKNTVYPLGAVLQILEKAGFRYVIESGVVLPFVITPASKNYSYKLIAWR